MLTSCVAWLPDTSCFIWVPALLTTQSSWRTTSQHSFGWQIQHVVNVIMFVVTVFLVWQGLEGCARLPGFSCSRGATATGFDFAWLRAYYPPSQSSYARREYGLLCALTDSLRPSFKTGPLLAESISDTRDRFGSTRAISIVRGGKRSTWRMQSFAHLSSLGEGIR